MKKQLLFSILILFSFRALAEMSLSEVAPGIYVHFGQQQLPDSINHGAIANIGFIVGENCVAVVDTGGNPKQGYD